MSRCTATTAKGQPCKKPPMKGRDVCKQHSGDPDRGRRPGLTEEIKAKILENVTLGCYFKDAAEAAGVSETSLYAWRERGEADLEQGEDTIFAQFAEALPRARAEARRAAVTALRVAFKDDWRAAAHYLERTDPANWGRRDRVALDHSGRIRTEPVDVPDSDERMRTVGGILNEIGVLDDGEDE